MAPDTQGIWMALTSISDKPLLDKAARLQARLATTMSIFLQFSFLIWTRLSFTEGKSVMPRVHFTNMSCEWSCLAVTLGYGHLFLCDGDFTLPLTTPRCFDECYQWPI